MPSITELTKAIYLHTQWRFRIKQAIHEGHCDISIEEAGDPSACNLGHWLQARNAENLPHYDEIMQKHAEFHQEVRRLMELMAQHKEEQANDELDKATSAFSLASAKLVNLLSKAQQALDGGGAKK